jgi:hypothetical protein
MSPPPDIVVKRAMTRKARGSNTRAKGVVTLRARSPLYEDQVKPPDEESHTEHIVCVRSKSKFTLEQILHYARKAHVYATTMRGRGKKVVGIQNPEGWAIAAYRSGEFDEIIERFYTHEPDMYDVPPLL